MKGCGVELEVSDWQMNAWTFNLLTFDAVAVTTTAFCGLLLRGRRGAAVSVRMTSRVT